MASLDELRDGLGGGPLSARVDQVLELVRPSIELATTPVAPAELGLGDSRIGGTPDLPSGIAWPQWKGEPQSFIAQLNLSSLASLPTASPLPPDGWLYFFYSARQDTWGFDPNDRDSWTVLLGPADATLTRRPIPDDLPDKGRFQLCRVSVRERLTLPPWESKHIQRLRLSEAEEAHYFEVLESLVTEGSHQLLGHPDQIQGDMTIECQLVAHGLNAGDSSAWSDPRAEELQLGWAEWQLLLQVTSDDAANMMWGDLGYLYFWIRQADLKAAEFDQVWMLLQCS